MATDKQKHDSLDDFFVAADAHSERAMRQAAENIGNDERTAAENAALDEEAAMFARSILNAVKTDPPPSDPANDKGKTPAAPPEKSGPDGSGSDGDGKDLDGKFIALDPEAIPGMKTSEPFVLVPANVYAHIPWWGWVTIATGLVVFVAAVVLLPGISLNRLASRLGDRNEATAQKAMRQLVVKGDERTVRKLFDMASSPSEGLTTRLRAVDTMSLIERVPEVDRALLRLELSGGTHDQVREAAIAARKQREAYKTRQNP